MQSVIRRFNLLPLLLPMLLAGCSVMFVAPYDEITDLEIQALNRKTEITITDVVRNRGSYGKHAQFYIDAEGSVNALESRARIYPKNEAEVELLGKLRLAYGNLETLHREIGPFRLNETTGVRSLLRQLLHHELSKKRGSSLNPASSTDTSSLPQ